MFVQDLGAVVVCCAMAIAGGIGIVRAESAPGSTTAEEVISPESLLGQIAAMQSAHRARQKEFHDELQALAKERTKLSPEEYRQKTSAANQRYNQYLRPAAEALIGLIKAHRTDPDVIEGILLLEGPMSHSLNVDPELVQIVLEDQLQNLKLGLLCYQMRWNNNDPVAEAILKNAAERHALADVRGQATYALGEYYRQTARKDWGRKLTDADEAALLEKAAGAFRQVLETYPEVKSPDGKVTLREEASKSLSRVTNIPNLQVGKPAPEFTGEDLEGRAFRLTDYRGKVVVVVFWGSWCGPCMARVPHEKALVDRMAGRKFVLVGVNCGDSKEKALQAIEAKGMNWQNLYDGDSTEGPIQCALNVLHWPTLYVLDREGIIRAIDPVEEELDRVVDELVGE